jgi:hypothetical protein
VTPVTWGGDAGFIQFFKTGSGTNHAFSRPNACGKAYIVSDPTWANFVLYPNTTGHPRSDRHYANYPWLQGAGHYQFFRYGFLFSTSQSSAGTWYNTLFGCDAP